MIEVIIDYTFNPVLIVVVGKCLEKGEMRKF
jgi:hypothetical protein